MVVGLRELGEIVFEIVMIVDVSDGVFVVKVFKVGDVVMSL